MVDYNNLKLYRRRYIPNENVWLKDDKIIWADKNIIVTKWKTLKPRLDFSHGCSCFYIKDGIKVSRFFDNENNLLYNYCDIIDTQYNEEKNEYVFNDLLIDVVVYPDGKTKILDIAEVPEAFDKGLITIEQMKNALTTLDKLLVMIYSGDFEKLLEPFENNIKKTTGIFINFNCYTTNGGD